MHRSKLTFVCVFVILEMIDVAYVDDKQSFSNDLLAKVLVFLSSASSSRLALCSGGMNTNAGFSIIR